MVERYGGVGECRRTGTGYLRVSGEPGLLPPVCKAAWLMNLHICEDVNAHGVVSDGNFYQTSCTIYIKFNAKTVK